jgi:hypothetical protein
MTNLGWSNDQESNRTGSSGVAPCALTTAFSGDFAISNENGAVELI